ncbi:DUF1523 family protein [Aquicoccus sp. SCR17]|nr:DUF1523 family protein [Carideicomes alvinocaridis]
MRYVKWTLIVAFWLLVAAFLHYTLPQRDIVRITDTYTTRVDFGNNSIFWSGARSGNAPAAANRDVFFIQTRRADGDVMVYRNQDTGWGWPPYFKFDTADLQAEASDLRSTSETPRWVAIRHYGWRNDYMSIYPNAVSLREVAGPDVSLFPWFNTILLVILAAIFWAIWVRWRRFRRRRIDPLLTEVGDNFEDAGDSLRESRSRFSRWLKGSRN